jgi:hypothetical protein
VKAGAAAGQGPEAVYKATYAPLRPKYGHWVIFDHCMPFDVTRAYDEATQYRDPRIWTAERDQQMWKPLWKADSMALTYDSDGATIQRHSFDYRVAPTRTQRASPGRPRTTRWWWSVPARWA